MSSLPARIDRLETTTRCPTCAHQRTHLHLNGANDPPTDAAAAASPCPDCDRPRETITIQVAFQLRPRVRATGNAETGSAAR